MLGTAPNPPIPHSVVGVRVGKSICPLALSDAAPICHIQFSQDMSIWFGGWVDASGIRWRAFLKCPLEAHEQSHCPRNAGPQEGSFAAL